MVAGSIPPTSASSPFTSAAPARTGVTTSGKGDAATASPIADGYGV